MKTLALVALLVACGGKPTTTRYYQLAAPSPEATTSAIPGDAVIAIDTLATDPAYDDERIVYRTTPYRVDYYHYHRWSTPPGVMIGNYLEQALERSGRFRMVLREHTDQAPVVLRGRVVVIEEVDSSKTRWHGRLVLELRLADARSGEVLWSEQFEELEPLATQSPEGLAHALSQAMARVVARVAPVIADHAERRGRLHAEQVGVPPPVTRR